MILPRTNGNSHMWAKTKSHGTSHNILCLKFNSVIYFDNQVRLITDIKFNKR